jgi:hypothetical protein
MARISKTTNPTDKKPEKLSPNVAGLRQPSAAAWQAVFDELERADVPDDFLSDRPDNGPAKERD